jgi:hypothetical protein
MKMSKVCQRMNNKLLIVLAKVTEEARRVDGFSHLTHTVQFDLFPSSLLVLCHFSEEQQMHAAQSSLVETILQKQLHKLLLKQGIVLKDSKMNLKLQGPT